MQTGTRFYDVRDVATFSLKVMGKMSILLCCLLTVLPVFADSGTACSICNCTVEGTADCSFRNLNHIPEGLSASITTLNMSSNRVQVLRNDTLKKFKNLRVLDLYNNSLLIQNISSFAFAGLSKLKSLNISHNDQLPLTNATTPLELFENMTSLQVLRMFGTTGTYNVRDGYPDVQLSKLKSLEELWIDGLTNMTFGPGFRNMSNLKVLRLAGDHVQPSWRSKEFCMTDIHDGMLDNLISITHLFIRKCSLVTVEKNAFRKLENLEYLDVSKNIHLTLKGMSTAFGSLQNKTNTLILDEIEMTKPTKYTVAITKDMLEPLQNLPIRELHFNRNNIELVEEGVFKILPKTLEILSAKQNDFFAGYYILSMRYLENLTWFDLSYQSFGNNMGIWRQSKYTGVSGGTTNLVNTQSSELSDDKKRQIEIRNKAEYSDMQFRVKESYDMPESGVNSRPLGRNDPQIGTYESSEKMPITIKPVENDTLSKENLLRQKLIHQVESPPTLTCPQLTARYIPPGTVTAYIPPKLQYLDLSHSKLASPIIHIYINNNNSLKILNASYSLLICWEGPVHGLEKLEQLDLSRNYCNNISNYFFNYAPKLNRLSIHNNYLGPVFWKDTNGKIMEPLKLLKSLDISYNRIHQLPNRFLKSQRNVVKLYARGNLMEEFNIDIGHMSNLEVLDLSLNSIKTLSESFRGDLEKISSNRTTKKRLFVNLEANPIHCYCYNLDFLRWVYNHFKTKSSLAVKISECYFNGNQKRVYIYSREYLRDIVADLENDCRSYVALIVGLSILLAVIVNIILGIIVHKHRWQLQYWYYVVLDNYKVRLKTLRTSYEPLGTYTYDVFVASTEIETDKDTGINFILDKLRPKLQEHNLRAFIQVCHTSGNDCLVNVVGKAIHTSRAVLFVFADKWSDDKGMDIAVRMWQCDMAERSNPMSVFGIFLDELIGKDAAKAQDVRCRKVIDYPGDVDTNKEKTFWRECVENIRRLGQDNTNTYGTTAL